MIFSLLYREFIGIFSLSFIPLVFYFHMSERIKKMVGILLCSFIMGAYVAAVSYRAAWNFERQLIFEPEEKYRKKFEKQIEEVGMCPNQVKLRYAYNDDAIGLTLFNTIIIDPMLWKSLEKDIAFTNAQKIINTYVMPAVSPAKKKFQEQLNKSLTPLVQRFIFKHELSHVDDNFSWKKIILVGFLSILTTFIVLNLVTMMLPFWSGWLVYVLALLLAVGINLGLNWTSNYFFKAKKEKEADLFAAKYCSKEEINAAADFFEQYEKNAKELRKTDGITWTDCAPQFFRGYASGEDRVKYLREIAESK